MERAVRWSLWLLLPFAVLLSVEFLVTGLGFGFDLWVPDRPFIQAFWFATILFPLAIYRVISSASRAGVYGFYGRAALLWAFVAIWLFVEMIWRPWGFGGPWGW